MSDQNKALARSLFNAFNSGDLDRVDALVTEGFTYHGPGLELTGKEALKEILNLDPTARVIMISSLGTDDAVTECLQAGARRFIQKPFDSEQLLNAMRSVLRTP